MPPTTTPTNGTAIRVLRERYPLSVRDMVGRLAELGINVHEDHLRNVETDAKNAGSKLAHGIARVLDVPVRAILAAAPSRSTPK